MLNMQLRTCSPGLYEDPQTQVRNLVLGGGTPKSRVWVKCYQHPAKAEAQAWSWDSPRVKGWGLGLKQSSWVRSRSDIAFISVPQHHIHAVKNKVGLRLKLFFFCYFSLS